MGHFASWILLALDSGGSHGLGLVGATLGQAQRQFFVTVTGSQARITTGHTYNANYDRLSKKNIVYTQYAEEDKEKRG